MKNSPTVAEIVARYRAGERWFPNLEFDGLNPPVKDNAEYDFSGVDLSGCDFSGGWFDCVSFRDANLTGTFFTFTHLKGSDFTGANLAGANFEWAAIDATTFRGADLSRASFGFASAYGGTLAPGEQPPTDVD